MPVNFSSRKRLVFLVLYKTTQALFVLLGISQVIPNEGWGILWVFFAGLMALDCLHNQILNCKDLWNKGPEILREEIPSGIENKVRLLELDDLRIKFLITHSNYTRRRNEILDSSLRTL